MSETQQIRGGARHNGDSGAARWTQRAAGALAALTLLGAFGGCTASGELAKEIHAQQSHVTLVADSGAETGPAVVASARLETSEVTTAAPETAAPEAAAPETAAVDAAPTETAELAPVVELAAAPARRPRVVPVAVVSPVDPADAIADAPGWAFFSHVDAPIRDALRTSPLASAERGRGGRSLGFKVTLEDGTRGYFKPDQEFNGMSWNAEVAAYYLDRELGFGRTAPVVSRRFDYAALEEAAGRDSRVSELHVDEAGQLTGAVIWWVPERLTPVSLPDGWQRWLRVEGSPAALTPFQRPGAYRRAAQAHERTPMPSATPEPDVADRPAELSDLILFDYLTNNLDRWGGNNTNIRTVGAGGPIMFLDNAAGFTLRRPRNSMQDRRLAEVQRFRRSTIDALRSFDVEHYAARLAQDSNGQILDARHLTNLEIRRQHVLAHVDALVAEHGAEAVYF